MSAAADTELLERERTQAAGPAAHVRSADEAALAARHLAKHYGGRTVLRDVSLRLHRG